MAANAKASNSKESKLPNSSAEPNFKIGDRVEWSPEGRGTKPQERGTVKWIGAGATGNILGIQFDYPRIFQSRWWNDSDGANHRLFSSKAHYGGFFDERLVQIDEDFAVSTATKPKSENVEKTGKVTNSEDLGTSGAATNSEVPGASGTAINSKVPGASGTATNSEDLGTSGTATDSEDRGASGTATNSEDLGTSGTATNSEVPGASGTVVTNPERLAIPADGTINTLAPTLGPKSKNILKNFQVGNRVSWKREHNLQEVGTIRWISILEIEPEDEYDSLERLHSKCMCNINRKSLADADQIIVAGITFEKGPIQISSSYFHHGKVFEIKSPIYGVVVEIEQLQLQP